MGGRLNGRVSRLENGRPVPCEACGFDGDLSDVGFEVEWADEAGPEETTYCEACGEPTTIVVTWPDIPPDLDIGA